MYIVVELYRSPSSGKIDVVTREEGFYDILDAEAYRILLLKKEQFKTANNIKVLQYG